MLFVVDLYIIYPKVRQVQGLKSCASYQRLLRYVYYQRSYAKYHGMVDISQFQILSFTLVLLQLVMQSWFLSMVLPV